MPTSHADWRNQSTGQSLAEVRDAAGHANIATTSIYTHVTTDDGAVGDLFGFTAPDVA